MLDAARAVFLDVGLTGANIREIAKRAGYTPGAIYSYFDAVQAFFSVLDGVTLADLMKPPSETAPLPRRAMPARPGLPLPPLRGTRLVIKQ